MRIGFFGTAEFAVPALEALSPHVEVVVSQPDRPAGRGLRLHASPVKSKALELGLSVATPEKCRAPEFVESIHSLNLDFLVVAAYGQILPESLLASTQNGAINLHGSILPKYRGAAPIQRAILEGEADTGVTLMQMDKGMDTGDVIAIERISIGSDETAHELTVRLAALAAALIEEWAPRIAAGDYPREPQANEAATYAPKVEKHEAELRFDRNVLDEYRRFRAFTPSPGPFLKTAYGKLKLGVCRLGNSNNETAGSVVQSTPELELAFRDGSLLLMQVQPEGKPRMSGRDWANGQRILVGMNLRPE